MITRIEILTEEERAQVRELEMRIEDFRRAEAQPDSCGELELAKAQIAEIRKSAGERYAKKRRKRGLLTDCKNILSAVDKADFEEILDDLKKLYPLADKMDGEDRREALCFLEQMIEESFANCQTFLLGLVEEPLSLLEGEAERAEVERLVLEKAQSWYSNARAEFNKIRQGTLTNMLTKVRSVVGQNTTFDKATGETTITSGNLILRIPGYDQLVGLRTSVYQLLDSVMISLTESGAKSPTVRFTIDDYMSRRGLKDRKEAKKRLTDDLAVLLGINITMLDSGTETRRGRRGKGSPTPISGVSLMDSWKWADKNKTVMEFTFGATFYQLTQSFTVMPYPAQLQRINPNTNPNSFYLLRKIAEHKNMNVGKDNEDLLRVDTLLKASPYLPTYEAVASTDRAAGRRIIDRFERDMNGLEETLTWEYCHSKGEPLSDAELNAMDYDIFKDLLVRTVWKAYPDQTARLERKAERSAKSGKKKQ